MEYLLQALTYHRSSDEPLSVLVILAVRVTVVLATATLTAGLLGRASAAVQHRVWLLALWGTLIVPLVWAVTPSWRLPLLSVHLAEGTVVGNPALGEQALWPYLLVAIWLAGSLAMFLSLTRSIVSARRLFHGSKRCEHAAWLDLVDDARTQIGLARPVELRMVDQPISPAVWSFRRVRVLLPEGSQHWKRPLRESVLLHELAHAARRDCISQLLAGVVTAVWWFHPLAWYAARQMRAVGEQAADDCVIRTGRRRTDYAEQLFTIAAMLTGWRHPGLAQTMHQPSHFERRLRAILDPDRRRQTLSRAGSLAIFGLALVCGLALATWTPSIIRAQTVAPLPETGTQPGQLHVRVRGLVTIDPTKLPPGWKIDQPGQLLDADGNRVVLQPAPEIMRLLPNWPAGKKADRPLPNYRPGMAKIVPLEPNNQAEPRVLEVPE